MIIHIQKKPGVWESRRTNAIIKIETTSGTFTIREDGRIHCEEQLLVFPCSANQIRIKQGGP